MVCDYLVVLKMRCYTRKTIYKLFLWMVLLFLVWEILFVLLAARSGTAFVNTFYKSVLSFDEKLNIMGKNRVDSSKGLSSRKPELKDILEELNREQYIRNANRLGLRLTSESVVIIVQVHNRVSELKHLIKSLTNVKYIERSLVIFSHDIFSEEINDVIKNILAFPVLQIFYPYSLQAIPNSFPGTDPNDCPRDMNLHRRRKCNNADNPDSYGHFREAKVVQMKHHWLWQMHFVMERVNILRDYDGTFLRIDEDYYLLEDTIHIIAKLRELKAEESDIKMLILGDYEEFPKSTFRAFATEVRKAVWQVGVGRGMSFERDFWDEFKFCAFLFCTFDDYNWDWSLQYVILKCMGGRMYILQPMASRVYHTGICHGFHRNNVDNECSIDSVIRRLGIHSIANEDVMFPKYMSVTYRVGFQDSFVPIMPNGGWADPRDHLLCQAIFNGNMTDTINLINRKTSKGFAL